MTVTLVVAISVAGVGMLALAGWFGRNAVRRARPREAAPRPALAGPGRLSPGPLSQPTDDPPKARDPIDSPRTLWIGAGISAVLGAGALSVAAVTLLSASRLPLRALSAPPKTAGMRRDDTAGTRRLASRQRERLKESGMPNPLTAVYRREGAAAMTVLFIGAYGPMDAPTDRLRDFLAGLAQTTGAAGRRPSVHPAGRLKGTVLCMDGLMTGSARLTTCGWADEGTLGVIATDRGDTAQTAALLLSMREDMERTR